MLAIEHEAVRPDIVLLGKALSGGGMLRLFLSFGVIRPFIHPSMSLVDSLSALSFLNFRFLAICL